MLIVALERAFVKARLIQDQGKSGAERSISFKDVRNVFKDFKIFVGGFMYFGYALSSGIGRLSTDELVRLIVPAYGYAFFAPGIIQSYGYSQIQTQCQYIFSFIS